MFRRLSRRFPDPGFIREVLSDRRSLIGFLVLSTSVGLAYILLFEFVGTKTGAGTGPSAVQITYSMAIGSLLALSIVSRSYSIRYECCAPRHDRKIRGFVKAGAIMGGIPAAFVGCCGWAAPALLVAAFGAATTSGLVGTVSVALTLLEVASLVLLWIPFHQLAVLWDADLHGRPQRLLRPRPATGVPTADAEPMTLNPNDE